MIITSIINLILSTVFLIALFIRFVIRRKFYNEEFERAIDSSKTKKEIIDGYRQYQKEYSFMDRIFTILVLVSMISLFFMRFEGNIKDYAIQSILTAYAIQGLFLIIGRKTKYTSLIKIILSSAINVVVAYNLRI
jgi:hypothetical protein